MIWNCFKEVASLHALQSKVELVKAILLLSMVVLL
jgi:hypothetical protein